MGSRFLSLLALSVIRGCTALFPAPSSLVLKPHLKERTGVLRAATLEDSGSAAPFLQRQSLLVVGAGVLGQRIAKKFHEQVRRNILMLALACR